MSSTEQQQVPQVQQSETIVQEQLPDQSQIQGIAEQKNDSNDQNPEEEENQNIASIAEGGRELSKNVLYVGNIHRSAPDEAIEDLFNSLETQIKTIKILQDKNKPDFNYAFIEFETLEDTDIALQKLDGTIINDNKLKVNKAFQTQRVRNNDTFNLFIGDLSLEVNDELLNHSFGKFPSLVQANVMWDMKSGRSRGYGFVCFSDKLDAENALQTMNGAVLGDRAIRLNWASHRDQQRQRNFNNHNHNNHFNQFNNMNMNMNMNNMNNGGNFYNNNNNNMNNNPNNNNINNNHFNQNHNNNNNNLNNGMNSMNNLNIMNSPNNSNNINMMNMINNSPISNQANSNAILMNSNGNSNNSSPNNGNTNSLINNMNNMNMINGNMINSMDLSNQQQGMMNFPKINNRPPMNGPPSYDMVLRQTPGWLTVVYLGNLSENTTQNDLIPLLQNFGYIINFKLIPDKCCAFVTYDSHERAAVAIVQLSGFNVNGRPLKCGWGKGNKPINSIRN